MWISYFWIPNREVDNRHTISSLHQRLEIVSYANIINVTQKNNTVYRKQVEGYGLNRHFYMHDFVTAEALYDAAGSRLQGTENTYELRQQADTEVFFPALVAVKQSIYGNRAHPINLGEAVRMLTYKHVDKRYMNVKK